MTARWEWSFISNLDEIPSEASRALSQEPKSDSPFLSLNFLKLLADSKSVDGDSGWLSRHILITEHKSKDIVALVPCYLKTHSYGEYVFDHAWASAYHQHNLSYYPKLLCAVPFTPVTGSRALIHQKHLEAGLSEKDVFDFVAQNKQELVVNQSASSLHILFLKQDSSDIVAQQNMHQRLSVQFVWSNQNYQTLDDFMQQLTSRKRRSIRKERAPFVNQQTSTDLDALHIKTLSGEALSQEVIDAFYLCYQQTYFKRSGHAGYLTQAFFDNLLEQLKDYICIVAAFEAGQMIAGSLFFYNHHSLFGRYWGALKEVSGLHFECCYYRGIEFAIEQGIQLFNPGTQGEHKILRGFRPSFCYSNHYLVEPAFDAAVADFVRRERPAIDHYHAQASELLPFKQS